MHSTANHNDMATLKKKKKLIKYTIYKWEKLISLVQKNTKDRDRHTILIFNNNKEESINPVELTF